jgi:hypothetical protein
MAVIELIRLETGVSVVEVRGEIELTAINGVEMELVVEA